MAMQSSIKTFSNSACLGNWFEDRIQQESPEGRIIADYGYKIFDTDASRTWGVHKDDDHKYSRAQNLKKLQENVAHGGFAMAQQSTFQESIADRKSSAPEEGFGAILPKATADAEKHFTSNSQYAFGTTKRESTTMKTKKNEIFAGSKKPVKEKGNQPKSLSGEVWKDDPDPKNSTLAQRAWMYGEDPAIHYKLNGYPVLKPEDIANATLPIGEHHNKAYNPQGNFKRVALLTKCSDVGGSSRRPGENVWMDV
ncbi:hypothetical protein ScalyP_jg11466 [Parmales sp. scaly parma]|nr:hypothetical protein ScalyP_jg11466 [Parmales sp. scaly parma]